MIAPRFVTIVSILTAVAATAAPRVKLRPFEEGDRSGYKDARGKVVLAATYRVAEPFTPEGLAAVVDDTGWAWIKTDGKVVARPLVVDNGPDDWHEGLTRIQETTPAGVLVGVMDRQGRIVVAPKYAWIEPFSKGRAQICVDCKRVPDGEHWSMKGGAFGTIDRKGRVVVPPAPPPPATVH